jgi:hypothetical protein
MAAPKESIPAQHPLAALVKKKEKRKKHRERGRERGRERKREKERREGRGGVRLGVSRHCPSAARRKIYVVCGVGFPVHSPALSETLLPRCEHLSER